MKYVMLVFMLCTVLFISSSSMKAQDTKETTVTGFRGDFLHQLTDIEKKLEDLADAMPAESYAWRPADGVRSVSEVYIHIASANWMFPGFWGAKKPDDLPKDMEKTITDKGKVIATLKESFKFIRESVANLSDADLDKTTKMFGEETTYRGAIFVAATHMHEHLGQSIAYARMNKIVPPWTAAEQKEMEKKAAGKKKDGK